ncbi:MAG: DUF853 family protein [Bacteroidia bacterium]|nr:DUF853 family protein [Bacteroidota bacterium]MBP9789200.1 DUF853 family protein [Bacteroidia bacterium]MBP9923326.1 DUF853 family protein [Bacteroidia bacterium]
MADFKSTIDSAFSFQGDSILIGTAMLNKEAVVNTPVRLPLNMVSRHGLIAGATGTGKTKTIQHFAESLSEKGVSVLLMDIKGDLSGIARPGVSNPKIDERVAKIGGEWKPKQFPVELMSISGEKGLRLRATVSEFGPLLLSKILELNDNQQGAVTVIFKFCDDHQMPLLDIKDFREVLRFITNEGKENIKEYGTVSTATAGVIMRKLLELEQQGGDIFFGEKSFDVNDLLRKDSNGQGFINIIRLCDIQDKPKLFSTFMLCLLAEIYKSFPEMGDKAAPKIAIFIDEAHLIFNDASKALMDQLEQVIRLIRSKGVGIYFCTQVPSDIPESVLSQLGSKFQHAMRAFTANDRKDIKLVAQNYPETEFYKTDSLITEMGIGEAMISVLNEKGIPAPLVHTLLSPPVTRMDILTTQEQDEIVNNSSIARSYNEEIDRNSAYEMLKNKIQPDSAPPVKTVEKPSKKVGEDGGLDISKRIAEVSKNPVVKQVARELTRGLMGMLFGKR